MIVQLKLPEDVERRLLAEVSAGRHRSLEDAILEKLSRSDEPELLGTIDADWLRQDLNEAWTNRAGAVDGEEAFRRISERSATLRAKGKSTGK